MIRKISDILLLSDLDGTLFDEPYGAACRVSAQNCKAVKRFIEKGGNFAIASGRAHPFALELIGDTKINAPSVFVNGGYLYNPETKEFSCQVYIEDITREEVKNAVEEYGKVALAVYYTDDGQFQLIDRDDFHLAESETCGDKSQDNPASKVYKYMIFTHPENINELVAFMKNRFGDKVEVVISANVLVEILPKGNSKASGIKKLIESTGWDPENVIAVGDYYNDIEMLDIAGIAVAMGNAPDDVKAHADFCVKSCEEHGVADLIERLEQTYL